MDFYISEKNCYNRLKEEFKKYGKLIFAVDFDDTLYDFHKVGREYHNVIHLLRKWRPYAEIIIFTGNGEEKYEEIQKYLLENDIPFNGINCNSSVHVNGRKIYANAYIDDRGGLPTMYKILSMLIEEVMNGELSNENE